MKRLIVTIIIVVLISTTVVSAGDQFWGAINRGMRGGGSSYRSSRSYGSGSSQNFWGALNSGRRSGSSYSRSGSYGRGYGGNYGRGYGRSENTNVRKYERWDSQGGESSYERSPDYGGKIIDSATILAILSIMLH